MGRQLHSRAMFGVLLGIAIWFSPASRASEFLFVDDFENSATLTGRVLDTNAFAENATELPIQGVEVTLLGVPGSFITGADGSFILRNVPPGEQILDLNTANALPAPTGDGYAGFRERIVLQGFRSEDRPFYLPRIDAASVTTIDPNQTTVVENPNLGIEMTVTAGSARGEDGQLFDGQLSISEVPSGLAPATLPEFLEPGLLITIQPVGVTFDPPAPITFPNFDNLPPDSETDLWSLDPETGQFIVVGTGRVSPDGSRIDTISGGIIAADWHAPLPPPPRESDGDDDGPPDCDGCCPSCAAGVGSSVDLFNGEFSESFRLPGVFSLNREFAPEFVYTSRRADPFAVVPVNTGIVGRAAIPNRISYRGFIDDQLVHDEVFVDTGTLTQRLPVGPPADQPFRVAVAFDTSARATGIYDANVMVTSIYDRSRISRPNPKALTVVNEIDSPFGAGWSLSALDRLVPDAPGTIRERLLLVEGDGGSIQFEEQLTGANPDGTISIVIPQNTSAFWATETSALIAVLDDMGLSSQLIVGTEFTQAVVDQSRLVIFMDFTFRHNASSPVIQQIAAAMKFAQDNGVPTFYIGQEPAFLNNTAQNPEFMQLWLDLWNIQIGTATAGGEGQVTVTDPSHPIFDGPAGALTQFNISGDVDITRGSNSGETTIAQSATADIVLVEESAVGGRNVTMNTTFVINQPTADQDELEIIIRNAVAWLLQSPSLTSGFFGEGEFAAVDGDHSGIIRDPGTGSFTRVLRDGTVHLFDADGRIVSIIDRNGNSVNYAYDGAGRVQTQTDPAGRTTTFGYDGNGRLASITDPAGRVTGFEIDPAGNLVAVTFPDGSTRAFGYDAEHRMIAQTSARGFSTQYQYDEFGFFSQSTQPDGSVRQVEPAQKIGLVDTSGGLGSETTPAPIVRPETALSGFTDPMGRALSAATGRFGEPVDVAGFDGLITGLVRDADGNPLLTTLPSGHTLSAAYDSLGNLLATTDGELSGTFSYSYEPGFQRVRTTTDPFGNTWMIERDAAGNPTTVTSPAGRVETFTYTPRGTLATGTDGFGTNSSYSYDASGQLVRIDQGSGPAMRTTLLTRTAEGYEQTITNDENQTIEFAYDANGRTTQITLPDGSTIANGWNGDGDLVSVTPPGRPAHGFSYTPTGQLAGYQPPAVGGAVDTNYTYNLARQLTRIDRPDGRSVVTTYDSAGRLQSREMASGVTRFEYDPASGLLAAISAPGNEEIAFSYQGDRLVGEAWSGTINGSYSRSFDAAGRIASNAVNGADPISFSYDNDALLIAAGALQMTRDTASGAVIATTLGQITDSWSYNEFGEITAYQALFGGNVLYEYDLTRDKLGRITAENETVQGVTATFDYSYDSRNRLERVDRNAALAAEYSYDANSNRLSRSDGVSVESGSYDDQDRATAYGAASYTYRQSGELLTRTEGAATTTFDYDEQGNLLSVARPDGVVISYVIDGLDRRIGKKIDGVLVQGLLYKDDLFPVAELDGAGDVVARFVYGTRAHVPDYMIRGGETYRIISDQIGSVRLVVDMATGVVAQRLDYDEFGRLLVDTNPGFQPFGFAGGIHDPDTGLVRFGARDYDPQTGRWTTKDPILFAGDSSNLYSYVNANPLDHVDPTGLNPGIGGNPPLSSTDTAIYSFGAKAALRAPFAFVAAKAAVTTAGSTAVASGVALLGAAFVGDRIGDAAAPYFFPVADAIGRGPVGEVLAKIPSPPPLRTTGKKVPPGSITIPRGCKLL